MTSSGVRYLFSGHQTFPFRYGWLEKGVRAVEERPTVFSEDDALVRLGVGKNMVESIRHWCFVTQLIEAKATSGKDAGRSFKLTEIARRLLTEGGWDPFLEDDASLWLIHWLLVTNPRIVTSWQLLFSRFNRPDFERKEITEYFLGIASKENLRVNAPVISRDVDCLIRSYAGGAGTKKKAVAEESFDCPLLQLNLIQPSLDGDLYRFSIGPKASLPAPVFAFTLHEHFQRACSGRNTMSVQECLYGAGSPGQAFKLDENSLVEYIEEIEDFLGGSIALDETAGLKQIYRRKPYDPMAVLTMYYQGDFPK